MIFGFTRLIIYRIGIFKAVIRIMEEISSSLNSKEEDNRTETGNNAKGNRIEIKIEMDKTDLTQQSICNHPQTNFTNIP